MSARVFFPDNTVLINFAHIGRVTLLGDLLPTRQWCNTVAVECGKSAGYPGLADLNNAPAVFGAALEPDRAERIDTEVLRQQMAQPGDRITAHQGEAETIAIIQRRNIAAVFATDDNGAAAYARANNILVVSTWDLIRIAHRKFGSHPMKPYTDADAYNDACTLRANKRGWPSGVAHNQGAFDAWLKQA